MIFQLADAFPPDATERSLPDAASGLACMARERPELLERLRARHSLWATRFGPAGDGRIAGIEAALLLGVARLGERHGRYGNDFHAYHNEEHALDLLLGRIDRLYAHPAANRLGHEDWLALELFAAHHDLRQREHGSHAWDPVGANEAASIAESRRILAACGFSEEREQALYHALELMIAGSTFDVRPPQPNDPAIDPEGADNSADLASGGGALAPRLLPWMQQNHPLQASRACITRALRLACIAADIDTANVGEPFASLCRSAVQLTEEREMRAGRRLGSTFSAGHCRDFLLQAQTHYLEDLHRFASAEGEALLGAEKQRNRLRMQALIAQLKAPQSPFQQAATGTDVIAAFQLAAQEDG
jgi:hypothetical protein